MTQTLPHDEGPRIRVVGGLSRRIRRLAGRSIRPLRRVFSSGINPFCPGPDCAGQRLEQTFEDSCFSVDGGELHLLDLQERKDRKWYPGFSDVKQPIPSRTGVTRSYRCTVHGREDPYGNQFYQLTRRRRLSLRTRSSRNHAQALYWITEPWYTNYYHWLVFHATKIALFRFHELPGSILLPEAARKVSFVSQCVEMLGVTERIHYFPLRAKLAFDDLRVLWRGGFSKRGLLLLKSYLQPDEASPAHGGRLYLSRAKAQWRRAVNEGDVLTLLEGRGFATAQFEGHTLADQIRQMSRTSVLLGLHGAGLTNMLFMPEGSTVIELLPARSDIPLYWILAELLGHRYIGVECETVDAEGVIADIEVPVHLLERLTAALD